MFDVSTTTTTTSIAPTREMSSICTSTNLQTTSLSSQPPNLKEEWESNHSCGSSHGTELTTANHADKRSDIDVTQNSRDKCWSTTKPSDRPTRHSHDDGYYWYVFTFNSCTNRLFMASMKCLTLTSTIMLTQDGTIRPYLKTLRSQWLRHKK